MIPPMSSAEFERSTLPALLVPWSFVVLRTPWRKFVDWEIKATLDAKHGLIGLLLPTISKDSNNQPLIPGRLYDNWRSGYAILIDWASAIGNPRLLVNQIEAARSRPKHLINNLRPLLRTNRNMRAARAREEESPWAALAVLAASIAVRGTRPDVSETNARLQKELQAELVAAMLNFR